MVRRLMWRTSLVSRGSCTVHDRCRAVAVLGEWGLRAHRLTCVRPFYIFIERVLPYVQ